MRKRLLFNKIPSIILPLFACESNYLFNESVFSQQVLFVTTERSAQINTID